MVNEDATPVLHPKTGQRPRAHMDALVVSINDFVTTPVAGSAIGEVMYQFGRYFRLPFYQFTQPSVAVSLFSGNLLDLCDSFSVQLLRGQGPQNATHGDQDSSPGGPPNAPAGDPTGPSPAVRRPPRSLSTATRSIGPD